MFDLKMYLPRSDGTREAFCENTYRRVRPCDTHVVFDQDNNLISGMVAVLPHGSLKFCSLKCAASYIARTQK